MIYLLYGKDGESSLKRYLALIEATKKSLPGAVAVNFNSGNFDADEFLQIAHGKGMFCQANIISCNGLLEKKDHARFLSSKIMDLANSPNVFIFREGDLDDAAMVNFKNAGAKVEKFNESFVARKGGELFNMFSISDAFGARDRKKLWVAYQKMLAAGIEGEEALWKIIWQIKMILFVTNADLSSAATKKLKFSPFVLDKSRSFSKNFKADELKGMYWKLLNIFHLARRGEIDMEVATERFVMEV
ncbi:MAG: hypothetical protein WC797_00350 [Candidatus Paceibacterota bacterium]|jgi:DNA polymerase III delta subunit